jgi:23S rRNA pseudouridine2605 synthase
MNTQPIIKLLTASGIGSRRQITTAIKNGRVALNGKTVESFLQPVNILVDRVTVDGKPIQTSPKPRIYLMLNKPKGITSTTYDERDSTTVIDILPKKYQDARLYPVGRLDKDSTGLILLTNDGQLTYRLTHPRFEREKEYLIKVEGTIKPDDKRKLEKGIILEEGPTHEARVKAVNSPPFNYSITIHEGRKRQVRRMFASLGYQVLELKRIRLGSLQLNSLAEGQTRELTSAELKDLQR